MKSEVGVDRGAPRRNRLIDLRKILLHLGKIFARSLFRRDADGLDLHSQSKLKHVLHIEERAHLVRHDAEGRVCRMISDKYAGSLAADNKARGTKGGHGFANNGATDFELTNQFLLRRQPFAAGQGDRFGFRARTIRRPAPCGSTLEEERAPRDDS